MCRSRAVPTTPPSSTQPVLTSGPLQVRTSETIMVLKQRTALLTGVSVERQKLIFKGVLDDAQLVSGTALTDNSKVSQSAAKRTAKTH